MADPAHAADTRREDKPEVQWRLQYQQGRPGPQASLTLAGPAAAGIHWQLQAKADLPLDAEGLRADRPEAGLALSLDGSAVGGEVLDWLKGAVAVSAPDSVDRRWLLGLQARLNLPASRESHGNLGAVRVEFRLPEARPLLRYTDVELGLRNRSSAGRSAAAYRVSGQVLARMKDYPENPRNSWHGVDLAATLGFPTSEAPTQDDSFQEESARVDLRAAMEEPEDSSGIEWPADPEPSRIFVRTDLRYKHFPVAKEKSYWLWRFTASGLGQSWSWEPGAEYRQDLAAERTSWRSWLGIQLPQLIWGPSRLEAATRVGTAFQRPSPLGDWRCHRLEYGSEVALLTEIPQVAKLRLWVRHDAGASRVRDNGDAANQEKWQHKSLATLGIRYLLERYPYSLELEARAAPALLWETLRGKARSPEGTEDGTFGDDDGGKYDILHLEAASRGDSGQGPSSGPPAVVSVLISRTL